MRYWAMTALAATMLAGCATDIMSEKECLAGDWYGAGLEDGRLGETLAAFDLRAAQCNEYGAGADGEAYMQGRADGLAQLCTYQGGSNLASAGRRYLGVCRPEQEPDFLAGYLSGRRIAAAGLERSAAQSAYDSAVSSVDFYHREIDRARKILNDPQATDKQRDKARRKLERSRASLPRAEDDVDQALYDLGRADEAYDRTVGSTPGWLRSGDFMYLRDALLEAYELARADDAVESCADAAPSFLPVCQIRAGARIVDDQTGAACVVGPGDAVMARRGMLRGEARSGAALQSYDFYPLDPSSGRTASRPNGGFNVFFDETGAVMGVACAGFPRD